jgi:hypothetical protein
MVILNMRAIAIYSGFCVMMLLSTHCCGTANPKSSTASHSTSNSMPIKSSITQIPALVQWYPRLDQSMEATIAQLQPAEAQIVEDAEYERLKGLTRVSAPATDPAFYYLNHGKVTLIFIDDPMVMSLLHEDALISVLGAPAATQEMASRVGKQATHFAYPEDGVAFSVLDGETAFVELFAPMSMAAYLDGIYLKPGPRPL